MADNTVINTGICKGDYCDPSYLPYPNMNAALYGYDITKADPFSTGRLGGDPGWRNALFFATTGSDLIHGAVQLHKSIEARDVLQCAARFEQTNVINLKKYKEQQLKSSYSGYDLKIGNDIEVEMAVEVPLKGAKASFSRKTTIPPFMTRSSSNTESEKQVSDFFSNEGGSMINLEAACSVHVVDIVPNVVPLFNEGFANGIGKLASASSSSKEAQKYAFKEFYQNYGTHYSLRTTMGSKLVYSMRISQEERAQSDIREISKCANVQGLKVFGIQTELNTEKCNNEDKYKSRLGSSQVGREAFASFGSKPATTFSAWAKQKFDRPMPLTMQLVPLPRLFTEENLAAVSEITKVPIDQKALVEWYLPMWEKLCEAVDIPCKHEGKGCGFNDKCTWDQICVTANNTEGYECQSVKACKKFSVNKGSTVWTNEVGRSDCGSTYISNQIGHGGTAKVTCNEGFGPVYSAEDQKENSGTTFMCKSGSWQPFLPNACHTNRDFPPTEKSTECSDTGDGIIYLDRHTVDCGGDMNFWLSKLTVTRCRTAAWMQYDYKCMGGGAPNRKCFSQNTRCNTHGEENGRLIYLDRHNVDCLSGGKGYYLNKFHLSRCGDKEVKYDFTCCAADSSPPANEQCETKLSACADKGSDNGKEIIYLDRQIVDCNGKYLRGFQLQQCDDVNIRYKYYCCY